MKLTFCTLVMAFSMCTNAQTPYGDNPAAGHYVNVGDANIYYEVYGTGKPVVLLHGGIFGYIDEYNELIPALSKNYMVIAVATRGHGKSGLGNKPLSYKLFADDTYKVIQQITKDSVLVIGFSDGADLGYYLAAEHPATVKKLVAIGGNWGATDFTGGDKTFNDSLNAAWFAKNMGQFITERKKLMPEPERFDEFVNKLADVWRQDVYVTPETIKAIKCPTMIAAGQNDGCPIEHYTAIYRLLQHGEMAIVPGCDHLVLPCKPKLMVEIIRGFLEE
jgi:pimeloyl-ACP methyl ester carboxylesterase